MREVLKPWFEPKLFEIGRDKIYPLDEKEPSLADASGDKVSAFKEWFLQSVTDISDYASYKEPESEDQAKVASGPSRGAVNFAAMGAMAATIERPMGNSHVLGKSVLIWEDFAIALSLKMDWAVYVLTGLWIVFALALIAFVVYQRYLLKSFTLMVKWSCIGIALVLPSILLLGVVWLTPTEEPLAWWGGVSIWPAEAIRLFAFTLSTALFTHSRRSLARNATGLDGRYVLWGRRAIDLKRRDLLQRDTTGRPPRPPIMGYGGEPHRRGLLSRTLLPFGSDVARTRFLVTMSADNKSRVDVCGLWRAYTDINPNAVPETRPARMRTEASTSALWRIVPLFIVFTMPLVIVALWSSNVPARGAAAYLIDKCILVLVAIAFMVLLLYVLNATLMCRRFIAHLVRRVSHYPPETLYKFADEHKIIKEPFRDDLADWLDVQLIANRTRVVATLIYWPILILLLLWFSYNQTFDGWHRPLIFYAILLLPALLMLVCQIALCREAEKGRRRALDRMDHKLSEAHAADDDKGRIEQLKLLIEEIEAIQEGAFRPLSQQPFLKAILLPFASVGTIQALEYISMVGG